MFGVECGVGCVFCYVELYVGVVVVVDFESVVGVW